ncbi:MAG: PIN domain-containing protein [Acidobacteria bacterium]|nr:PIN domain-containing protein [Acidobacteriota bacterium]
MIAVDTNILVYAHREDSPWHADALGIVTRLAEGPAPWAIPWPCLHEFLAIVTHPRIFVPPTPLDMAVAQVEAWMEAPGLVMLGESEGYWAQVRGLLLDGRVAGPLVHDARVAALCIDHGIEEFLTADRDFSRFPQLSARNPLVAATR